MRPASRAAFTYMPHLHSPRTYCEQFLIFDAHAALNQHNNTAGGEKNLTINAVRIIHILVNKSNSERGCVNINVRDVSEPRPLLMYYCTETREEEKNG